MQFLPMILLITVAVGVTAIARHRGWPAPLLVTGLALAAAGIPGIPEFHIDSHIILTLVLPPLLYSAALDVSLLNFARSRSHIISLGIGLVVVTAGVVGAVIYWLVPDMTLPTALLIGAIVAPPDAVSASAIGRRLGLPRPVMTVLSGESLINDAASLTLFKVFLAVLAGETLTVWEDIGIFGMAVVVGVVLGLLIGVLFHWIRMRIEDPVVETLLGLVVPFLAYIGAEELGGSGVLAVVAAGLWIGFNSPRTGYAARLTERPVWSAIDLLLEGVVFALIGLQMKPIGESLAASGRGVGTILGIALVTLVVVILIRPAFIFGTSLVTKLFAPMRRRRRQRILDLRARREASGTLGKRWRGRRTLLKVEPPMGWRELTVLSWTSMRGVVTLAAAAAVPAFAASGAPVPAHDLIVFLAFFVTIGTLLLQGLTLPFVIRLLGVQDPDQERQDRADQRELMRITLAEGIEYLEEKQSELVAIHDPELVDRLVRMLHLRAEQQQQEAQLDQSVAEVEASHVQDFRELRRKLLRHRRAVLVRERDRGTIDEEVMREVLNGLDAEELALDTSNLQWDRG